MITKALPITKRVELIDKRELTKILINENFKIYMILVADLSAILIFFS